jgi:antitoxin CptB
MDETPAPAARDARRRRLLFRATHRGTRENDLLLGGFVSARIDAFTEAEMGELDEIMELPDPMLADWLTGRVLLPETTHLTLLFEIRAAARRGEGMIFAG